MPPQYGEGLTRANIEVSTGPPVQKQFNLEGMTRNDKVKLKSQLISDPIARGNIRQENLDIQKLKEVAYEQRRMKN